MKYTIKKIKECIALSHKICDFYLVSIHKLDEKDNLHELPLEDDELEIDLENYASYIIDESGDVITKSITELVSEVRNKKIKNILES